MEKAEKKMRDYEPFRRQLAGILMEKRQHLGFSQEDLALRAKLHRTYISDVERGERNISIESLRRLSIALGIPMWKLIKLAEEQLAQTTGSDLAGAAHSLD